MPKSHRDMGFKSLKTFNQALLAKQGWRILQNENGLLHQIYKARYFPHGTFFESKLGANPSNLGGAFGVQGQSYLEVAYGE